MYDHLKDTIKKMAKAQHATLVDIRRHLHMYPELSFQEFDTAKFIATTLKTMNIELQEGIANTGLVALIRGKNPTKAVVALRADIDALPIHEANEMPYKSKNKGVMHACGHDVHTASLIGVARLLNALKEEFEGTIKLIFQPAEEKNPGGAVAMIQEGVLAQPQPVSILGQHVDPSIPVGKVGFVQGTMLGSADELYITVKGKGGHAASPQNAIDPILIAAHIIVSLQQLVSRSCNPIVPSVLSLCHIQGGETTNVIPEVVQLSGTFRTTDEHWRSKAHHKMQAMASGIANAMGGHCVLDINRGYPCLNNEPALTQRHKKAAIAFLGTEQVIDMKLRMWAEDFAYYAQHIPGCFYYLGVQNRSHDANNRLHTPTFNADEKALEVGPGLMTWLALQELAIQSHSTAHTR
ncbi:MAG: M20 metallopeptidase family protein [Bacteroidota bacterium]